MKNFLFTVATLAAFFANAQAPSLDWAKQLADTQANWGTSITVDRNGNVYTVGYMEGVIDVDPGPGTYTLGSPNVESFYTLKQDSLGNFLWADEIHGFVYDVALDTSNNVHITRFFSGVVDFDPGPSTTTLSAASPYYWDMYVLKLSTQGNFMWVKSMGTDSTEDAGFGIAVDRSGNVHVAAQYADDILITKLDKLGNFLWTRQIGSVGDDEAWDISVDTLGQVYTTGYFSGTADFDPGPPTYNLTPPGPLAAFVLKMDAGGNFIWAKQVGSYSAQGQSIGTDSQGNVAISGRFSGMADFDPGPSSYTISSFNGTNTNELDLFVLKLDPSGNFIWAKQIGGVGAFTLADGLLIDPSNNIYYAGDFVGTVDFDPSPSATYMLSSTAPGTADLFFSKMDPNGNFLWAERIGGPGAEWEGNIAMDHTGRYLYSTGHFEQTCDFDPGTGVFNLVSAGSTDGYILKLKQVCSEVTANSNTNIICRATTVTLSVLGASTYTWNTGATTSSIVVTPLSNTTYTVKGMDPNACAYSTTFTEVVSECVGFENFGMASLPVSVYPNPNAGEFTVSASGDLDLVIVNAVGQVVRFISVKNGVDFNVSLNNVSPGIYFMVGEQGKQPIRNKVVIEK